MNIFQKRAWLIEPEALDGFFSATRAYFEHKTELPKPVDSPLLSVENGIGIISIHGPMMRRPDLVSSLIFGAVDTEEVIGAVNEAKQRPDVQAIFLDIDSPGGSVNGTPELAQAVAGASRQKFVYAFTGGQMCSAAYWVASQCDAIYATPSARVGSIGVILAVVDSSVAFAQAGLKMEIFAAGKFKAAGAPGTSLTDEQRDWLQNDIEEIAADVRSAVLARGRKIPDEAMEGQTFSAKSAMRFNLAGMVESRDEALARLRSLHVHQVDTASSAMQTIEQELESARAQIAALEADAKARESLIAEAASLQASVDEKIQAATLEIEIAAAEAAQLRSDLATARETLAALAERNAQLEAAEKDIEKRAAVRAAQIVAETGTQAPANITPKGDHQTATLVERFRAISDPKEQTTFWRSLTPQQQAQILAAN